MLNPGRQSSALKIGRQLFSLDKHVDPDIKKKTTSGLDVSEDMHVQLLKSTNVDFLKGGENAYNSR